MKKVPLGNLVRVSYTNCSQKSNRKPPVALQSKGGHYQSSGGNLPFTILQLFWLATPSACYDLRYRLKPVVPTKRACRELNLCSQLVLSAALASFRARKRLEISAETYEERRERRRPVWSGLPIQNESPVKKVSLGNLVAVS